MLRYSSNLALANPLVQVVHIFAAKRWLKSKHLVDHAAHGPDIALVTVRLVSSHLWGGVVRSSRLSVVQTLVSSDFAHIHVANFRLVEDTSLSFTFDLLVLAQEYVS